MPHPDAQPSPPTSERKAFANSVRTSVHTMMRHPRRYIYIVRIYHHLSVVIILKSCTSCTFLSTWILCVLMRIWTYVRISVHVDYNSIIHHNSTCTSGCVSENWPPIAWWYQSIGTFWLRIWWIFGASLSATKRVVGDGPAYQCHHLRTVPYMRAVCTATSSLYLSSASHQQIMGDMICTILLVEETDLVTLWQEP